MRRLAPVFWFPLLLATVAVLVLWTIERSPLAESAKAHLREVVSVGFSLAIVAFLAVVALFGLPAPWGLVAAGTLLVSSGAWAVTQELVGQELPKAEPECPDGGIYMDGFCFNLSSPAPADSDSVAGFYGPW
jgi:hypothetical protein